MERKNFGLSHENFERMRLKLKEGNDSLFEQIFLSHFKDCIAYLKTNFTASQEEIYDASMDTMLEFRKYLIMGKIKYGNLRYLFTRMAGQRLLRIKKLNGRIELTEELPEMLNLDQTFDNEDILLLNQAWSKLTEACQELLKKVYYDNLKLSEIAGMKGKNAATLRKQKERCVTSLRAYFKS